MRRPDRRCTGQPRGLRWYVNISPQGPRNRVGVLGEPDPPPVGRVSDRTKEKDE
jgi:hypothetical protein